MTRRRAVASLGLAILFATSIAASAEARPVSRAEPAVEAYRVSITLPNHQRSSAVVLVEHEPQGLTGMLIVDGSPASALQRVRIENGVLTAEVVTTSGLADLTLALVDRSTATLSLRSRN